MRLIPLCFALWNYQWHHWSRLIDQIGVRSCVQHVCDKNNPLCQVIGTYNPGTVCVFSWPDHQVLDMVFVQAIHRYTAIKNVRRLDFLILQSVSAFYGRNVCFCCVLLLLVKVLVVSCQCRFTGSRVIWLNTKQETVNSAYKKCLIRVFFKSNVQNLAIFCPRKG